MCELVLFLALNLTVNCEPKHLCANVSIPVASFHPYVVQYDNSLLFNNVLLPNVTVHYSTTVVLSGIDTCHRVVIVGAIHWKLQL